MAPDLPTRTLVMYKKNCALRHYFTTCVTLYTHSAFDVCMCACARVCVRERERLVEFVVAGLTYFQTFPSSAQITAQFHTHLAIPPPPPPPPPPKALHSAGGGGGGAGNRLCG